VYVRFSLDSVRLKIITERRATFCENLAMTQLSFFCSGLAKIHTITFAMLTFCSPSASFFGFHLAVLVMTFERKKTDNHHFVLVTLGFMAG